MKFRINLSMALLLSIAFAVSFTFSGCKEDEHNKSCEGYTGKITNEQSLKLVDKCHFLSKDSIEMWSKTYEEYKRKMGSEKDSFTAVMDKMSAGFLRNGSVSFNSCIIKRILGNENSIGLRVLYGIGGDNRIHIILVGIQPDYTNLYVNGEDCCDKSMNKTLGAGLTSSTDNKGGAEYGQMP